MNFPLCLQVHSCSTLWPRLIPPLSPDIHFIVIFPCSSNLSSVNNGKDNSYCEGKLVYEHYEKKNFQVMRCYCNTKGLQEGKVMGCHPVSFQRFTDEIQFIVQSFVLSFQTFFLRARCFLQKKETWMSAQMICCMTVVLWQRVNGLISCLWIFPTIEVIIHTASGWDK